MGFMKQETSLYDDEFATTNEERRVTNFAKIPQ